MPNLDAPSSTVSFYCAQLKGGGNSLSLCARIITPKWPRLPLCFPEIREPQSGAASPGLRGRRDSPHPTLAPFGAPPIHSPFCATGCFRITFAPKWANSERERENLLEPQTSRSSRPGTFEPFLLSALFPPPPAAGRAPSNIRDPEIGTQHCVPRRTAGGHAEASAVGFISITSPSKRTQRPLATVGSRERGIEKRHRQVLEKLWGVCGKGKVWKGVHAMGRKTYGWVPDHPYNHPRLGVLVPTSKRYFVGQS